MAAIAVHQPLVGRILPEDGARRIAAQIGLVVFGTLLIYVAAKINVPFWPVPMTMQTFAILVIAATYGFRLGLTTVLLYLAEGASGLPVFAGTPQEGIGIAYMMGPTGGYLVGFAGAAALVGWFAERGLDRRPVSLFGLMLASHLVIFGLGLLWLGVLFGFSQSILASGLYPFIPGLFAKTALAVAVVMVGQGALSRKT